MADTSSAGRAPEDWRTPRRCTFRASLCRAQRLGLRAALRRFSQKHIKLCACQLELLQAPGCKHQGLPAFNDCWQPSGIRLPAAQEGDFSPPTLSWRLLPITSFEEPCFAKVGRHSSCCPTRLNLIVSKPDYAPSPGIRRDLSESPPDKKQFDCARRQISGLVCEAVELRRRTDRIRNDVF
jgi:hypothetical protein